METRLRNYAYAHKPAETHRLLTLSEAADVLGVNFKVIYALAELGHIHALQRDGKGRTYYAEWEVRRAVTNSYHLPAAA